MVSRVSWFYRFRGVNSFMVSYVSCCQGFHCVFRDFIGFGVSMVLWFYRFRGVNGFIVSFGSWFHKIPGFNGFMVS